MAGLFDGTMLVKNLAGKLTGYPFTVGVWARSDLDTNQATVWAAIKEADAAGYFVFGQSGLAGTTAWEFITSGATAARCGVDRVGFWQFMLCRGISATNRRLSVLDSSIGSATHAQNTTSDTPAGITELALGGYQAASSNLPTFIGAIAEFWWANIDVQADGAQIDDAMLRQLAYGGPFSVPHIGAAVCEYRSLRQGIGSNTDQRGEVFWGSGLDVPTWTESVAVPLNNHPPLPYWYVKPDQTIRNLTV